jgi:hypothetical protein
MNRKQTGFIIKLNFRFKDATEYRRFIIKIEHWSWNADDKARYFLPIKCLANFVSFIMLIKLVLGMSYDSGN